MKKKMEFSKLIFWLVFSINIYVIGLTTYAIISTGDVSPLAYLIPATFTEFATATGFYYWKAKTENKLKLMKIYDIEPDINTLNDETYNGGQFQ